MALSLAEIARLVDGELHGDGGILITGADILRDAQPGEISFVEHTRMGRDLAGSAASAVLTPPGYHPEAKPHITVADVAGGFATVVRHYRPPQRTPEAGISPLARISPTARIDPEVTIHAGAVIGEQARIGRGSTIHAGAVVMAGCRVGDRCVLFPNVVLYEGTVVGARCLVHAGAVLGAHGFGYHTVDGRHQLSAQLGHVVLEDDVHVGACTTIDRGTYGATVIGEGTKIDNQVMIAHNCRIGRHNVICSQVGIAGSTTTGDYVVMAGQVGVRDHVHIGTGAKLGAKAGVMNDIPEGGSFVGIPATPERRQMLIQAAIMKLPDLKKQLRQLQRAVEQLEAEHAEDPRQEAA